jgi:hypothetical protein
MKTFKTSLLLLLLMMMMLLLLLLSFDVVVLVLHFGISGVCVFVFTRIALLLNEDSEFCD